MGLSQEHTPLTFDLDLDIRTHPGLFFSLSLLLFDGVEDDIFLISHSNKKKKAPHLKTAYWKSTVCLHKIAMVCEGHEGLSWGRFQPLQCVNLF